MRKRQTFQFIRKYLIDNDKQFVPKLSNIVDIDEYSKKISNLAEHFILFEDDNDIIGFAAVYCNDLSRKIAYLTYINIADKKKGKGYGKKLLSEIIKYAKTSKFKKLKLEVSKKNIPAISFYYKNKFEIIEENEKTFFMIKTIN